MKNELEYQKFKGLFVFCNKCKRNIHNKQKGKKCDHPIDKQVYKAIVRTVPDGIRKTKILEARDFRTAFSEYNDFEDRVKNPYLYQKANKPIKPQMLKDAIAMYIDYMHDEDVPSHKKNHLSKDYIKRVTTHLKDFLRFLASKGINTNNYKLSSINDSTVGLYHDYLEKKNVSNYTYNDKIKALRLFFNYLIDKENYNIKNLWKQVKLKSEKPTDISISDKDFYELLSVINPDDAIAQIGKTKRNMYRPWLKDLIKLKAFTGRRNAELFAMRWNMIHFEDGMPIYIESPNIKVNKQQNNFDEKDFQYAYIPVGEELLELLIELGLEENSNSDEYIITPAVENRDNLEKYASIYFSFFFKKLNRNYKRQLKHLRQTYITREDLFLNRGFSMQHSNYRTTAKHYINRREVAKQMVENGFRIFAKKIKKTLQKDTPAIKKDITFL